MSKADGLYSLSPMSHPRWRLRGYNGSTRKDSVKCKLYRCLTCTHNARTQCLVLCICVCVFVCQGNLFQMSCDGSVRGNRSNTNGVEKRVTRDSCTHITHAHTCVHVCMYFSFINCMFLYCVCVKVFKTLCVGV